MVFLDEKMPSKQKGTVATDHLRNACQTGKTRCAIIITQTVINSDIKHVLTSERRRTTLEWNQNFPWQVLDLDLGESTRTQEVLETDLNIH